MSNLFSGINARIRGPASSRGGAPTKSPTATTPPAGGNGPADAPSGPVKSHESHSSGSLAPRVTLPESPSLSESIGMASSSVDLPRPLPQWLNPAHAKHIVKGNFMTLSARPKTVEPGEWVAHQVVEHYRNLWNFVRIVHEKEDDGSTICNPTTCPKMSAGKNHSYTWLSKNHEPVEISAYEYMTLMQRWISGKIDDPVMFPTDPSGVSFAAQPDFTANPSATSGAAAAITQPTADEWMGVKSGFPKAFPGTCQLIFRQIFRVYAHLYWNHFVDPFYHLNLEKQLNSCFSHFILTATALDMLLPGDIEPMQYLVDLWAADGTFPRESKAYGYANLERGKYILSLSATN